MIKIFIIFRDVIYFGGLKKKISKEKYFFYQNILNFGAGLHGKKWKKYYKPEIMDWEKIKIIF